MTRERKTIKIKNITKRPVVITTRMKNSTKLKTTKDPDHRKRVFKLKKNF